MLTGATQHHLNPLSCAVLRTQGSPALLSIQRPVGVGGGRGLTFSLNSSKPPSRT